MEMELKNNKGCNKANSTRLPAMFGSVADVGFGWSTQGEDVPGCGISV